MCNYFENLFDLITLFPAPPLPLEDVVALPWALSRRLSLALKLLETVIFVLVSLAESTLALPNSRPHLLAARGLIEGGIPDDGEGEGEGDAIDDKARLSSVRVSFAGNYQCKIIKDMLNES